jgi:hypothetical protein
MFFQDGLDFGSLHREEVRQGLGHESDQASDDADVGFAFGGISRGVGWFGHLGGGIDDFDGQNVLSITSTSLNLRHEHDHRGWGAVAGGAGGLLGGTLVWGVTCGAIWADGFVGAFG